jgi:hypothetical protein
MPAPTASLATLRPDITDAFAEFGLEEDRLGFIGDMVLPVFEVPLQAGNSGRIPLEQWLQDTETARNNNGGYNRITWKFSPDTYSCEEHGLEGPIDARTRKMYAEYFDAEVVTAAMVRDRVLRAREQRIAAAIFNATTFTAQTTSVTNEWDSNHTSNATPLQNVATARQAVYDRTGLWPNALILNRKVFHNLRLLDQIIEAIVSSGAGNPAKQSDITVQMLSAVFDLEVIVAGGSQNTANEGQTAAISQIWSDEYAMVAKVAKSRNYQEPALGRTFHWNEDGSTPAGTIETYESNEVRGEVVRCRMDSDEKLIYPECAQLLDNITTP